MMETQIDPNACHSLGSVGMACHCQAMGEQLSFAHVLCEFGCYTLTFYATLPI